MVDASGGEVLPLDASITLYSVATIDANASIARTTLARSDRSGSFFRLLVPGEQYCLVVEATGYFRHYAAVMLPSDVNAVPSSAISVVVSMSRAASQPTAELGVGKQVQCEAIRARNSDAAPITESLKPTDGDGSDSEEMLEMLCAETEVLHHPDGRIELQCVVVCDEGFELDANIHSPMGFTAKCVE